MSEKNLHGESESVLTDGVVIRRDALPVDHPESWFGLWAKTHGSLDEFPFKEFEKYGGHFLINCAHCHEDMKHDRVNYEDVSV